VKWLCVVTCPAVAIKQPPDGGGRTITNNGRATWTSGVEVAKVHVKGLYFPSPTGSCQFETIVAARRVLFYLAAKVRGRLTRLKAGPVGNGRNGV
jgi:hypothetical protein